MRTKQQHTFNCPGSKKRGCTQAIVVCFRCRLHFLWPNKLEGDASTQDRHIFQTKTVRFWTAEAQIESPLRHTSSLIRGIWIVSPLSAFSLQWFLWVSTVHSRYSNQFRIWHRFGVSTPGTILQNHSLPSKTFYFTKLNYQRPAWTDFDLTFGVLIILWWLVNRLMTQLLLGGGIGNYNKSNYNSPCWVNNGSFVNTPKERVSSENMSVTVR